jgi:hypothetical protein
MKKFLQRAAVVMLAAALILSTAATAPATTWTVTSPADDYGTGTLRYAIDSARNGDTIVFDPSLEGQTISLLDIPNQYIDIDLTIAGPGANKLAISGGGLRAFYVAASAQVTISGLTLEYGGGEFGAFDPRLDDGVGGAIINDGELTLSDCVVSGNTAGHAGGGIANYGTMTIDNCLIASNGSNGTGSIPWYGGGIYNDGAMVLRNSTVTGNTALFYGGGIYNDTNGTLLLVSSNVSGNDQRKGKDIYNLGKVTRAKN